MVKKVTFYESDDGKQYKTKQGAENRNKKLYVDKMLEEKGWTKEEVETKLKKLAETNWVTEETFRRKPDWTKWDMRFLEEIREGKIFEKPKKKTKYYELVESLVYADKRIELAVETGDEFTNEKLHFDEKLHEKVYVDDVNDRERKIIYTQIRTPEDDLVERLEKGEPINEHEVEYMVDGFEEVYREYGDNRRWLRSVLSVVDVRGDLYAIDWDEALTESQENSYFTQPYPVRLEEVEVVRTETKIIEIERENDE